MKTAAITLAFSKCLKQGDENSGLLSYFVPENFIGFKCSKTKVNFSKVELPRVSYIHFIRMHSPVEYCEYPKQNATQIIFGRIKVD